MCEKWKQKKRNLEQGFCYTSILCECAERKDNLGIILKMILSVDLICSMEYEIEGRDSRRNGELNKKKEGIKLFHFFLTKLKYVSSSLYLDFVWQNIATEE